ncbi:MAG: DNA polymerase IV [Bacilli bacterium]|nr:DNA polymerase IV [Bacilli bacterium]
MRIIIHVDVNNAFLSWMAVEMLKNGCKFDIRKRYAVIGGDENVRRGIVLAKSDPCKRRGVVTAESLYMARRKCPYLEVYKGDYRIYKKYSDLMYNYLLQYSDIIERYSIDECFVDYTNSIRLFGNPVKLAYKIKDDIKNKYGFTVNVGVGNNKLLAKMASDLEKPDKVHTLFDYEVKNKMWVLPIEDLFMVGKSASRKLKEMGINTIGNLANSDKNVLIKHFKKHGILMWEYANGIDNSKVEFKRDNPKSVSSSTVLPYNYSDKKEIYKIIKKLSCDTGMRLRNNKLYANTVSIWVKYSNFVKVSKQIKLDSCISTDNDIYKYACLLFDKLWNDDNYIRGLCVGVDNLGNNRDKQLSLFEKKSIINNIIEEDSDNKLQMAMDSIRNKYGSNIIGYADEINNN